MRPTPFPLAIACALAAAAPAQAAVEQTVTASIAVDRSCFERPAGGAAGTDTTRVTAPVTGLVQARLRGKGGDWDLGVFDAGSRRSVAGAAGARSDELAEGFVRKGQRLIVQSCRFRGAARSARLAVTFLPIRTTRASAARKVQVVDVSTPARADKKRLQGLGLDLTEHGDADSLEVVLHGADDERRLRDAGFAFEVRIADLAQRGAANRRADARFAEETQQTRLPSGRDSYRRLADYELELKQLAMRYPGLVKPITLNHKTIEGRDVSGIEITTNPRDVGDGKPIFLNMGVHHAREWPSSEHAMEFAHDLLANYGRYERTTRLVNATRTIVIPIVNADGFNISREAAPRGDFSLFDYEMKRKNCRVSDNTPPQFRTGMCDANPAGRLRGTDPNRNYGGLWGGGGASTSWSSDTYRGDAPFSEPEVRNIRELQATRSITNLVTNHTYSNLVLRPPGVADEGFPLDEPQYKALGERMAARNGYTNQPSFQLYDTTGGTEDWTFWTAGSLGFTFEIGPDEFHPPFETGVVAEYLGLAPAAGAGKGGNREAYYEMLAATRDTTLHSQITGVAPDGAKLTLSKSFRTATSPVWRNDFGTDIGDPILFDDTLSYDLEPSGGRFAWHVNPSTRPIVAGRSGRDAVGPPQAEIALANPEGQPAENTGYPDQPYEAIPFTVSGPPDVDNGKMTVHIEWSDPNTDWDLYVTDAEGNVVTSSAAFGDTTEDAAMFDPLPGTYTAHVVNYDQVDGAPYDDWSGGAVRFESPRPTVIGEKESWTLTCELPGGRETRPLQVTVDRGQRREVGNACKRAKGGT